MIVNRPLAVLATLLASGIASSAFAQGTIKIGHIDPYSGALANVGAVNGKHMDFAVEKLNAKGGVLGRKLEIVRYDNKGSAQESVIAVQQAIDSGVRIITNAVNSGIAAAVLDAVVKHNRRNPDKQVLYVNYGSASPSLTTQTCNAMLYRFEAHAGMKLQALTDFLKSDQSIKKVYLIGQDYSFGREVSQTTKDMLKEKRPDIQIVGDEFHPIGQVKDFTPYVAKIKASGADAVMTGNFGNDLTLLIKAANDAGLTAKFFTQYAGTFGTPTAIGAAGKDRVFDVAPWAPDVGIDEKKPAADALAKEYKAKFGEEMYYLMIVEQMNMLAAAIEKAKSDDPVRVAGALSGMKYEGPVGPVELRAEDNQISHPLFVSRFTSEGITNDVEKTGIGFKTVYKVEADKTAIPATCKVEKPRG